MKIDIDEQLSTRLANRAEKNGFDSVEEYVVTVLETVLDELEESSSRDDVQSRLEDLGYLE